MATKTFELSGSKLLQYVGGKDSKVKYIRLFSAPDNPRWVDTMVELMALTSSWSEYELGELTLTELMDLWKDVKTEVEQIAVDPTPENSSETGDSEPKTKSPAGA